MDRLIVIMFVSAWGYAEVRAQARAGRAPGAATADRGSLLALYLSITLGYGLAFAASYLPVARLPGEQPAFLLVGGVLVAAGLWIRYRAIATLRASFRYRVEFVPGHRLVETGPYGHIRNPGYAGQLLVFLGVAVALASWLSIIGLMVPVAGAFLWRIRVEEAALRDEFGEVFDAYARRTARLVPGLV